MYQGKTKLTPCVCCGATEGTFLEVHRYVSPFDGEPSYEIHCRNCGSAIAGFYSEEEARRAWNEKFNVTNNP